MKEKTSYVWVGQTDSHTDTEFMFPAFGKLLRNPYTLRDGRIFLSHPCWISQWRTIVSQLCSRSEISTL